MNAITFDQTLDSVMCLPLEQQEMLLEIVQRRHIETRRKEMAQDAEVSLAAFHAGDLKAQSANEVITELHEMLDNEE